MSSVLERRNIVRASVLAALPPSKEFSKKTDVASAAALTVEHLSESELAVAIYGLEMDDRIVIDAFGCIRRR